ncbi:MAG TPA: hypothetical protein VG076_15400 [Acidimicrobiales bacterium]|jgi:hypothetical protein|nr:hypothetical protein [Acidimicrobiales bacterium]
MQVLSGEGIEGQMDENRWERYGAAAGVAFAVLVLVSFFMVPSPPHVDAGFRKIGDYYANHRRAVLTSNVIATFGALAFIWFLGHLRHVLNRAEGGVEALSPIVYGAGMATIVVGIVGAIPATVLAYSSQEEVINSNAGIVRMLYDMNTIMFSLLLLTAGLFAVAAAFAMVRKELVGPWLGWVGMGVAGLTWASGTAGFYVTTYSGFWTGFTIVAIMSFVAWVLAASVVMLRRPEVERAAAWDPVFAH